MESSRVYWFRDTGFSAAGDTIVCVIDKLGEGNIFDEISIKEIFGRLVVYTNDETNCDYIGVWGHRKASKFLRLLRERGGRLEVERSRPLNARHRYSVSTGTARY